MLHSVCSVTLNRLNWLLGHVLPLSVNLSKVVTFHSPFLTVTAWLRLRYADVISFPGSLSCVPQRIDDDDDELMLNVLRCHLTY